MTEARQSLVAGCVLIALMTSAGGVHAGGKPTRRTVVVPAKTALDVRLASHVASTTSGDRNDDPVLASLASPLIIDGQNVAPAASVVLGNLVETAAAGHRELRFDRLRVGSTTYDIRTAPVPLDEEQQRGARRRLELLAPVSIEIVR